MLANEEESIHEGRHPGNVVFHLSGYSVLGCRTLHINMREAIMPIS
jgi:hypothetical protein